MFPDSPFAHPVSSFQHPVTPPGADPDASPLIYVAFNQSYLAYVIGSLKQLLLQSTWKVSSSDVLSQTQQRMFTLINLFAQYLDSAPKIGSAGVDSEDIMIRQSPDNPCLLQTSINGVDWCTFADLSKCHNFGTQPGEGTAQPAPGGGVQQGCYQMQANNKLLLPTLVNSGDTIELVEGHGAGNDGGSTAWYCHDGAIFFAGACIPTGGPSGGDPLPTENHMSMIVEIAGTFYSLEHGPFIVPGGVVNEQATIQVNDSAISDNLGSYELCIKVTNNQPATWQHTFDFATSPGGWQQIMAVGDNHIGVWSAGVGWIQSEDTNTGGITRRGCVIKRTFASTVITGVLVEFDYTVGSTDLPGDVAQGGYDDVGTLFQNDYTTAVTGTDKTLSSGVINHTDTEIDIALKTDRCAGCGGAGFSGSCTIKKIVIEGKGTDPF